MNIYIAYALILLALVFGILPFLGKVFEGRYSRDYWDCMSHGVKVVYGIAGIGIISFALFHALNTAMGGIV